MNWPTGGHAMVCVQHSSLLHHFIFLLEIGGLQVLPDKRALRASMARRHKV
jgi:hypothetical protein